MGIECKKIIAALLDVTRKTLIPLTREAVKEGNLVFAAAILKKSDLSLVTAGSNHEIDNPLWHGEVYTLKRFYECPAAQRPETKDCIFYATHEPCSLCLSAITWAGFDNFYYLFTYEETRDDFMMPEDLNILKEVFHCEHGKYAKDNKYWKSHYLPDLLRTMDEQTKDSFEQEIAEIKSLYKDISFKK